MRDDPYVNPYEVDKVPALAPDLAARHDLGARPDDGHRFDGWEDLALAHQLDEILERRLAGLPDKQK